jgi:hypothetical protein
VHALGVVTIAGTRLGSGSAVRLLNMYACFQSDTAELAMRRLQWEQECMLLTRARLAGPVLVCLAAHMDGVAVALQDTVTP